jgi:hypothetical protein
MINKRNQANINLYVRIFLTYRGIGSKFGFNKFIADELTQKAAKRILSKCIKSRKQIIDIICKTYNDYRKKNDLPNINTDYFDDIHELYTNIISTTFSYLAKHPSIVDDLLRQKPNLLNVNMLQLWRMYKEQTYTEDQIRRKMKKEKIAFKAIMNGMFVRLLSAYEKLPEFGYTHGQ